MIVVTAATGKLGSLVVDGLLARVPAAEVAVAVRAPDKAEALAARGVEVRHVDYAKPHTLEGAFRSGDKVLLISSNEVAQRAKQQEAVVAAARRAGVALLAYTSILHAEHAGMRLAVDHTITEKAIRASGLPFAFLRNGWYLENYTERLAAALEHGVILGSAGNGRIAAAARADYAAAAVAVLTGVGRGGDIHELAGDESFTMSDLAAEVSRQSGKAVSYKDLPVDEYRAALIGFGLPVPDAEVVADADLGITRGELDDKTGTLRRLIGRPTTTLVAAVTAGLARATG